MAAILVVVLVGSAAAWWLRRPVAARTTSRVDLGVLPAGVERDRLNLVIVTLDTTRADRLGAYGSKEVQTPAFDALAGEGVLFEQAVSVAPLTLPAHSSIFTGKFPPEHGVRDNGGFFLGPEQVTLAEVLKARGYRTGAFVAAYVLDSKWGLNQGFDTYFDDFDLSQSRAVSLGVDPAARERGRGQGAAVDRRRRATPPSSRGFTSTTPTLRTGRPSRSRRATRGTPTTARSPSPTRRSAGSCRSSRPPALSTARSSW